jgi:FKBP-type peptidyl-prolyl cis-trans isomerase SlyD
MEIRNPCVVSLTWKLASAQNEPLDELAQPVEFFYGGDDLLAKVEDALAGHEPGAELHLHLEPADAFGEYQPELVCFEERRLFPEPVETGMAFEGLPEGHATPDMPADRAYIVTEVYPSHVVLDGNHPLAGIALRLHVKVVAVREASEEEIECRSVGDAPITVMSSGTAGGPHPEDGLVH